VPKNNIAGVLIFFDERVQADPSANAMFTGAFEEKKPIGGHVMVNLSIFFLAPYIPSYCF
jgi:hypothetical protein